MPLLKIRGTCCEHLMKHVVSMLWTFHEHEHVVSWTCRVLNMSWTCHTNVIFRNLGGSTPESTQHRAVLNLRLLLYGLILEDFKKRIGVRDAFLNLLANFTELKTQWRMFEAYSPGLDTSRMLTPEQRKLQHEFSIQCPESGTWRCTIMGEWLKGDLVRRGGEQDGHLRTISI